MPGNLPSSRSFPVFEEEGLCNKYLTVLCMKNTSRHLQLIISYTSIISAASCGSVSASGLTRWSKIRSDKMVYL